MRRTENPRREMADARRREAWSLTGTGRPVKVVQLRDFRPTSHVDGYFTLLKFLIGKTPERIQRDLGLPRGHLDDGAAILLFHRLPMSSEYDYELTTAYPGGLAYHPTHFGTKYPPGKSFAHQWAILAGHRAPVHPKPIVLMPGERLRAGHA